MPRINTPTLIFQGQLDTVVEPAGASWLHNHLASTDKTIFSLPHTDHLVALDRDRDQVIAATKAFVLGRRSSRPTASGGLTDFTRSL